MKSLGKIARVIRHPWLNLTAVGDICFRASAAEVKLASRIRIQTSLRQKSDRLSTREMLMKRSEMKLAIARTLLEPHISRELNLSQKGTIRISKFDIAVEDHEFGPERVIEAFYVNGKRVQFKHYFDGYCRPDAPRSWESPFSNM